MVNEQDSKGMTILHRCVDVEELTSLLQLPGIDVNIRNNYGETPLTYAMSKRRTNFHYTPKFSQAIVCIYLADDRVEINSPVKCADSILSHNLMHYSAGESEGTSMFEIILQEPRLDINEVDPTYDFNLFWEILFSRNAPALKLLLANDSMSLFQYPKFRALLMTCLLCGPLPMSIWLYTFSFMRAVNVNQPMPEKAVLELFKPYPRIVPTPLLVVAYEGDIDSVKVLIDAGVFLQVPLLDDALQYEFTCSSWDEYIDLYDAPNSWGKRFDICVGLIENARLLRRGPHT